MQKPLPLELIGQSSLVLICNIRDMGLTKVVYIKVISVSGGPLAILYGHGRHFCYVTGTT